MDNEGDENKEKLSEWYDRQGGSTYYELV